MGKVETRTRSIYRWEVKVHDEPEALRERVVALHPYECPEVLRLDVAAGHAPYLQWIADNVRAGP